jgi:hypothetical protein
MQGDRGKPTDCFAWPEKKIKKAASRKLQATSGLTTGVR